MTTAPSVDWLKSSQSTLAGEKPKCSWSTGADCTSAEVEVRSWSNASSRKDCTSSAEESASRSAPVRSRTAAQSVQERRSASAGAYDVACSKAVVSRSRHHRTPTTTAAASSARPTTATTTIVTRLGTGRVSSSGRGGVRLVAWPRTTCSPPAPSCSAPASGCCWCTARATTTGPSPRASSTRASTSPRPPYARCRRRPGCTCGSASRCRRQRYPVTGGRTKQVSYWVGPRGRRATTSRRTGPNAEIDAVEWVPYDEAMDRLTYDYDRATLKEARPLRRKTHARRRAPARRRRARARAGARTTGCARSSRRGRTQAAAAGAGARGVRRHEGRQLEQPALPRDRHAVRRHDGVAARDRRRRQRGGRDRRRRWSRSVDALVAGDESAVLCTHRPVLPSVFDALGVADTKLEPGSMLVVHLRQGTVTATEVHRIG